MKSRDISFTTKLNLCVRLVLLYGYESCTLTAEMVNMIQPFEMKRFRRLLHISWTEHRTKDSVQLQPAMLAEAEKPLLAMVRRKLLWFCHVTLHDTLSKAILQGIVEGGRCRGRQQKSWTEYITDWTGQDLPEGAEADSRRAGQSTSQTGPVKICQKVQRQTT